MHKGNYNNHGSAISARDDDADRFSVSAAHRLLLRSGNVSCSIQVLLDGASRHVDSVTATACAIADGAAGGRRDASSDRRAARRSRANHCELSQLLGHGPDAGLEVAEYRDKLARLSLYLLPLCLQYKLSC